MSDISFIIYLTIGSGACIPIGGAIATVSHFRQHWLEREFRHFVIAFGGGILLGAVSEVLVPQGVKSLHYSIWAIPVFMLGGITFFFVERMLGLRKRESPQLIGMVLDYVPEAMALGGMVALGSVVAPLLAVLIGLQNLPEGFNAYREFKADQNIDAKRAFLVMCALVPLGPLAGLLGYFFLSDHEKWLGCIMLFSAGGILYLLFQDIGPQSRLEKHWAPPLGAVLGFCFALFSEMMVHYF